MRIATFNIYWFGTSRSLVERSPSDDDLVARVIAGLDADVIALQEICDLARLDAALARASALTGRDLRARVGGVSTTSARPNELTDGGAQKVVVAWDAARVEPVAWGALTGGPALRPPLLARFQDRAGAQVTLAAVHMKSGRFGATMDDANAVQRHSEAVYLARWLGGEAIGPSGLEAPSGTTLALGDMNARLGDPSLAPFWALPGWAWPAPVVPADDPWTTFLDRDVIDLVGSAGADVGPVRAWDWDRDPTIAPAGFFQRVDDFRAQRAREFPKSPVENLYRVSDHRPVIVEV